MELCTMGSYKAVRIIGVVMLLSWAPTVYAFIECSTVTQYFSACSIFITYGSPDPIPGSPCCDAMSGLKTIANIGDNRHYVCRCLMGLIDTFNPNATAIGILPGLCGISLGFIIGPNIDCKFPVFFQDHLEIVVKGSISTYGKF
ncbi:putative non-specific lipid-transfer protein 14 [Abrus precatorius]|uniref:Non-specific lipid-transfer protein 14 n=1 Tax=Abrus precatorius TaxID=3816 RepID=A0A8B8MC81_ABRPR|nr:putative non-specific lipid-transfer protein 14 [Abrus precatorius]